LINVSKLAPKAEKAKKHPETTKEHTPKSPTHQEDRNR